jgi:hypothetical protein
MFYGSIGGRESEVWGNLWFTACRLSWWAGETEEEETSTAKNNPRYESAKVLEGENG